MNRIDRIFQELRARGGKALMPFVTAGDPDLSTTELILPALQEAGASVCELGFPFSDPIADGPVIQESMAHALSRGVTAHGTLEMVARQRAALDIGVVAMLSYSIVHRLGGRSFVRDAAAAGVDGLIVPDVSLEESAALRDWAGEHSLTCSFLVAPTTPADRAVAIARACTGFIYVVARAGVTGERSALPADLPDRIRRLRDASPLPIAVGFGVSSAQQVTQVVEHADAAIVGSAIVKRLAADRGRRGADAAALVGAFVKELAGGLRPAPSASAQPHA